jgi:hypothetical protein
MPHEALIMHHLRMRSGEVLPIHDFAAKIADTVLERREGVVIPKAVRDRVRGEVFRTTMVLVSQGKVIRYCHPCARKGVKKAGVRINEAFV